MKLSLRYGTNRYNLLYNIMGDYGIIKKDAIRTEAYFGDYTMNCEAINRREE